MPEKTLTIVQTLAQARTLWEENRTHKNTRGNYPEFDVMLEKFQNDCLGFREIGEELGITRERVRQIYRQYFSKIIPRRPDGRTRQRVCTLKKRSVRIRQSFKSDPYYATLFVRAKEHDIATQPVQINNGSHTYSAMLLKLNGHVCNLQLCETLWEPSRSLNYWRFNLGGKTGVEFFILQAGTGPETRFLVIPASNFPKRMMLYVPGNFQYTRTSIGRPAKVNWLEYLEAWHLLKDPPADPPADV